MEGKIILIEDDASLGYLLSEYLKLKDYTVEWADNGRKGFDRILQNDYDLCILDVMMPEMDGFTLAAEIKKVKPLLPFLFLTAKSLKIDVIKGLSLGAEDYIKKPVEEEELVLRIKLILRRTGLQSSLPEKPVKPAKISLGHYSYHTENQELIFNDTVVRLTQRENELLLFLVKNQGRLCDRKEILNTLWGKPDYFNRKSMDVFISKLRKYLSGDPRISIENVHGKGFIFSIKTNQN
ncbi:MAG: response regulator transcription factor [Bacteroidia bacterium]|nr:response regulator transcription factor [Bacteroidia bacterium]